MEVRAGSLTGTKAHPQPDFNPTEQLCDELTHCLFVRPPCPDISSYVGVMMNVITRCAHTFVHTLDLGIFNDYKIDQTVSSDTIWDSIMQTVFIFYLTLIQG